MSLPSFPASFNDEFPAGPNGQRAYVGLNVLRGLISGIDQALEAREQERSARKLGPVLIGVSPWLTDAKLLGKLRELTGAGIVITKQGRSARDLEQLRDLHELNANTAGLPGSGVRSRAGRRPLDVLVARPSLSSTASLDGASSTGPRWR